MKNYSMLSILSIGFVLSGCDQIPSECEGSWSKMEKLAINSGMPKEAVRAQKEEFVTQIKTMSKEEAIKTCKAQNSFLNLAD